MKLIVGLGNIGDKYKNNRHNMGFKAIDFVAHKLGITLNKQKFNGQFYKGAEFILAKPHTFMNLSGDFVYDICHFYKIHLDDVLIIYDDMDLELGQFRHRPSGSSGGHNGMNDIMVKFDTNHIHRLRIGIGRPCSEAINYLLADFSTDEWAIIASQKAEITNFVINFLKKS